MTHVQQDAASMTNVGFWTYIMTDCILFGTLFATYTVLHKNAFGGPTSKDIIIPFYSLAQTIILLTSSFCCGLAGIAARQNNKKKTLFWFGVTFLLGISFLVMEGLEFTKLVHEGASWKRSGFLSAFYTLVGTHGLHISAGLLWMIVMLFQVSFRGFTPFTLRRLASLGLFWHFLDVVWIFIFTFVYMMGA
ncbi:MAG: cytochrome o ubiquinol oxidase subunit III [Rhabdochlamydiaceae bacterium]